LTSSQLLSISFVVHHFLFYFVPSSSAQNNVSKAFDHPVQKL
jgi:hypothetical protein